MRCEIRSQILRWKNQKFEISPNIDASKKFEMIKNSKSEFWDVKLLRSLKCWNVEVKITYHFDKSDTWDNKSKW